MFTGYTGVCTECILVILVCILLILVCILVKLWIYWLFCVDTVWCGNWLYWCVLVRVYVYCFHWSIPLILVCILVILLYILVRVYVYCFHWSIPLTLVCILVILACILVIWCVYWYTGVYWLGCMCTAFTGVYHLNWCVYWLHSACSGYTVHIAEHVSGAWAGHRKHRSQLVELSITCAPALNISPHRSAPSCSPLNTDFTPLRAKISPLTRKKEISTTSPHQAAMGRITAPSRSFS